MRRAGALSLLALALAWPRVVEACASCGCGDPTMTALGQEKPFAGRVRGALELLHETRSAGTPLVDQLNVNEQRLRMQAAWAPGARVFLLATLPLVDREVGYVNLARRRLTGVGDLELRAKVFLWEDRDFAPHHLIAAAAGARLPTAPWTHDPQGVAWPAELQAGSGALTPLVGISYAWFQGPFSGYVGLEASTPVHSRPELRPGSTLLGSASLQGQRGPFAGRLGMDLRVDGTTREKGRVDPDSGGAVGYLSPAVLVTPLEDLLFALTVRVPVAARLTGRQRVGTIVELAAAYDF